MLSLPPKRRRGKCDGAVGGKKQELSLKREKRVNRGTYIPPKLANCSVNTHTHTHTHTHTDSGRGALKKAKQTCLSKLVNSPWSWHTWVGYVLENLKKCFSLFHFFRNSLVSGSRCKYRTVAGLRGIRVRVNPGKIWGKNRRVGWGKGLIVSGSFFSELPTKKRFGETPKRGKASLLLSFFPFPLLQQSNN